MGSNKSKTYADMKNYLHNELGIDRKHVMEHLEVYVDKLVDEKLDKLLDSNHFLHRLNAKIQTVHDRLQKTAEAVITEEVRKSIKFKTIHVDVTVSEE